MTCLQNRDDSVNDTLEEATMEERVSRQTLELSPQRQKSRKTEEDMKENGGRDLKFPRESKDTHSIILKTLCEKHGFQQFFPHPLTLI